MSFKAKTDRIEENCLSQIDINQYISNRVHHTDRFIKVVQTNHPEELEHFIAIYAQELKATHLSANLPLNLKNMEITFNEGSTLEQNPDLLLAFEKAILSTMQYHKYESETIDPKQIEILFRDQYRGVFIPEYLMAVALCKVLPRALALNTIKEYTRGYYITPISNNENGESLEEHAKHTIENSYKTHKCLHFVEDGRLYFKVQRCLYADAIQDLADKELIYYLECYGDYFNHQTKNKYYVMTRSKTCMKGDAYCDFCYHDKRFIEEINHPPPQFWEKLEQQLRVF